MPEKYDEVGFQFVHTADSLDAGGTVLLRQGEMVLEIPGERGANDFYLIQGQLRGHIHSGTESNPPLGQPPVRARWADFGDVCVGLWVEDGYDYLFVFRLPRR